MADHQRMGGQYPVAVEMALTGRLYRDWGAFLLADTEEALDRMDSEALVGLLLIRDPPETCHGTLRDRRQLADRAVTRLFRDWLPDDHLIVIAED